MASFCTIPTTSENVPHIHGYGVIEAFSPISCKVRCPAAYPWVKGQGQTRSNPTPEAETVRRFSTLLAVLILGGSGLAVVQGQARPACGQSCGSSPLVVADHPTGGPHASSDY